MNNDEIAKYKTYLSAMTDKQLDDETQLVILQNICAMTIQLCYNEWLNRGNGKRFLDAYNRTLNPG